MSTDSYFIRARLFPTLITSFPLLLFVNRIVSPTYYNSIKHIAPMLPLIANMGPSTALFFLCIQINRLIGKEIFQQFIFKEELSMPTTSYLLWTHPLLPNEIKIRIRTKIQSLFAIQLLDRDEEEQDETKGRKLISIAVSQIRNILRDNKMISRHNIEYGFWRNLFGGSLLAGFISLILLAYSIVTKAPSLTALATFLSTIYLLPVALSNLIIKKYSSYYAKVLFEQFLTYKA